MQKGKKHNKPRIVNCDGESITLDAKHDEVLAKIALEEDKSKCMQKQISIKTRILKKQRNKMTLSECFDIEDEIKTLRKEKRDIKKKRDEYYMQNAKYIFQYFESKQSIAKKKTHNKNYLLNDFFKIGKEEEKCKTETNVERDNMQRYLLNIDELTNTQNYVSAKDVCSHCSKGEMVMYDSDGILICTHCSRIVRYIIEHEKPSYKEPPKEVCFYAYKRINHFREILAQFQAKESTQIPENVLEDFKMQIKKERISLENLTNKSAKEILKKLNHSKYYEHVPFIKDKIGIKPPVMDNQLEETLCNLFLEIQAPYAKFCPDSRVNFLNYYYTIYKLCELLEKREFLEYFPMLKDKTKRVEQDNIWKNICKELNWRFIPTV